MRGKTIPKEIAHKMLDSFTQQLESKEKEIEAVITTLEEIKYNGDYVDSDLVGISQRLSSLVSEHANWRVYINVIIDWTDN